MMIPPSGIVRGCSPHRSRRAALAPIVIAIALLGACSARDGGGSDRQGLARPRAAGGSIDLSGWSFEAKGPVALTGEWSFYPGRLLSLPELASAGAVGSRVVPDFWKDGDAGGSSGEGAGTYHLRILLPPHPGELGIRTPTLATAFEIEANGKLVAAGGKPALEAAKAIAAYNITVAAIPVTEGALELLVRVSNHEYRTGGMWRALSLGSLEPLRQAKRSGDLAAAALFGAIAVAAIFCMLLYLLRPREDRYLYYSLFAAIVALRTVVTGNYIFIQAFPLVGFDTLIRIEYFTAFAAIPLAVLFLSTIFPHELGRPATLAMSVPSLLFILLVPFAPLPLLTHSINFYYPILLATIAAIIAVLGIALARRRAGSLAMVIGTVVMGLAGINDVLYSLFLLPTGNLLPYGLTVFIALQAFVLAQAFTGALDMARSGSVELSEVNSRLEAEVDRYASAKAELETLVTEKELLIKEVHHRVKNSLQIVSSIITLQSHRVEDESLNVTYTSIKNRIRAISLVHEKLYGLASSECVDLAVYTRELLDQLAFSYDPERKAEHLMLSVESIQVPTDLCIDIGLVLTELVANAFLHAVIPQGGGSVRVSVGLLDGALIAEVQDEGPGLPAGFSPETSESLGFRIALRLAKKRGGNIEFLPSTGAWVRIRIPFDEHQGCKTAGAGALRLGRGPLHD
jgi:two-component sensor histidine kinase